MQQNKFKKYKKIRDLRVKLNKKYKSILNNKKLRSLNIEYKANLDQIRENIESYLSNIQSNILQFSTIANQKDDPENDLKIIGVTGSVGKSSTAFMLHEYLKFLGYKSVLYSSIKIDNPASSAAADEAVEVTFKTAESVLSMIDEVEAYEADFLILEINETIIEKGFTDDIPFDLRIITHFNPTHNMELYTEEEYTTLKKDFFNDVPECKNIICMMNTEDTFNEFLNLNDYENFTFSTRFLAEARGVSLDRFNCLLTNLETPQREGITMTYLLDNKEYQLKTNFMVKYQIFNMLPFITALHALDLHDNDKIQQFIRHLVIPGRAEHYWVDNKLVVIDQNLDSPLLYFKLLKNEKEWNINNIILVVGATGSGYVNWDETFNSGKAYQSRHDVRKAVINTSINQYIDVAYLTENENGAESVLDICQEMQASLSEHIQSYIIEDRADAIEQAITNANENDIIVISGRGNRRIFCNSATTMKLFKDSDAVESVIRKLVKKVE